jgi:hypothetical protein
MDRWFPGQSLPWQKGCGAGVGSPQMRWGSQPMTEFYLRATASRIKEMFIEARRAIKEMFD